MKFLHLYHLDGNINCHYPKSCAPDVGAQTMHETVFWCLVACHRGAAVNNTPNHLRVTLPEPLIYSSPRGTRAVRLSWATPCEWYLVEQGGIVPYLL
jgi:hypothetical protein